MRTLRIGAAVVVVGCSALLSCEQESNREPAMQPASRTVTTTRAAASAPTSADNAVGVSGGAPEPGPPALGTTNDTRSGVVVSGSATTTSAAFIAEDVRLLTNDITRERCDRAMRCKSIGSGMRFESRVDCESKLAGPIENAIGLDSCHGGLKKAQVDRCMNEIRNERCDMAFDDLSESTSCRSAGLCID
jgi:hypothetical protein